MNATPNEPLKPSRRLVMPPALVILMGILIAAALAAVFLPQGEYQREQKRFPELVRYTVQPEDTLESIIQATGGDPESIGDLRPAADASARLTQLTAGEEILVPKGGLTRNAVIPGSYQRASSEDAPSIGSRALGTAEATALAPIEGFVQRAQIIGFVLLLGGAFGVILGTGAIDAGLQWAVLGIDRLGLRWAVIPTSFALFSFGGAVFGLGETTIAIVLITIPLAIRLGHDTITGVAMCYMASQVGFGSAFFNPFTVGIAQGIAELPYLTGLSFRVVAWSVCTLLGIGFTVWWAQRVKCDPTRSPTYAIDQRIREHLAESDTGHPPKLAIRQALVVFIAFGSVFLTGYGVAQLDWYINEMAALFAVAGVACGLIHGFRLAELTKQFVKGAEMMVEPCLIIALSAGVVLVLQQGLVLDTILHALATPLEALPPAAAAVVLMCVQAVLNFFVPSGSGQAAMTMPIVTPLCDLVGLNRQVGVLAFQFGDGFTNLIVPTSAVLMGVLGVARVPWTVWVRWVIPLVVVLYLTGAAFLLAAVLGPAQWMA
ncbi:MAG: Na+/H+ antiporter NhaC family protein [Planctomycetota bacterium]